MDAKNTVFRQKKTLNVGGKLVDLSVPKVMGILNLTPDSFFDGGHYNQTDSALKQVEKMLSEGAEIIDIGAYSSRPGAEDISPEEEAQRLVPVLKQLSRIFPEAVFSIDTFRAVVAETAINEGAHIINDIAAGELDENMFETVARLKVPYILMHMRGTPQTMKTLTQYEDVFTELISYFEQKIHTLTGLGVVDLIVDPGFGFAKSQAQSYELLNRLKEFERLGHPVLAGLSRKSMIYKFLNSTAGEALNGTTVANTIALINGANILRVHDVKAAVEAVKLVENVRSGTGKF